MWTRNILHNPLYQCTDVCAIVPRVTRSLSSRLPTLRVARGDQGPPTKHSHMCVASYGHDTTIDDKNQCSNAIGGHVMPLTRFAKRRSSSTDSALSIWLTRTCKHASGRTCNIGQACPSKRQYRSNICICSVREGEATIVNGR